ncbi:hypothetical protein F2P81_016482 [Scophthalmus maximus]|uniref:Uncharacterized protein n=1 Tax=Scophthalmus maximus TaxID=52904 RepID=A0A6A4SFA9_SCOMX|nr:hypothetical protein F2P81_016482 [Scophthalmus maximus]
MSDLFSRKKWSIFQTVEISVRNRNRVDTCFTSRADFQRINFPIRSVFVRFFEKREFPRHEVCAGLSKHFTAYTSMSHIHSQCLECICDPIQKLSWPVNKGCFCKPSEKMFAEFSSAAGLVSREERRGAAGRRCGVLSECFNETFI